MVVSRPGPKASGKAKATASRTASVSSGVVKTKTKQVSKVVVVMSKEPVCEFKDFPPKECGSCKQTTHQIEMSCKAGTKYYLR